MSEFVGKKHRLTLEIDQRVRETLEDLRVKSGAASLTEVIRKALALYDLHFDHYAKGGTIILRFPDGTEERLQIL